MGCCALLQALPSQPRHRTPVSYVSCIGRQVLYHLRHLGSTLGRWLRLNEVVRRGPSPIWQCPYKGRSLGHGTQWEAPWWHREETAAYKPQWEAYRNQPCRHPDPGLLVLKLWEINICCLSPPVCGHSTNINLNQPAKCAWEYSRRRALRETKPRQTQRISSWRRWSPSVWTWPSAGLWKWGNRKKEGDAAS